MPTSRDDCREILISQFKEIKDIAPFQDRRARTGDNVQQIPGFDESLHAEELNVLKDLCLAYRAEKSAYALYTDRKNAAIVVSGARGHGKTTLAFRLQHELPDAIIIRITDFASDERGLARGLLRELVSHLISPIRRELLESIADRLAAEVLGQQLKTFTDVEWLRKSDSKLRSRWWLGKIFRKLSIHWGTRTTSVVEKRHQFLEVINPQSGAWSVKELLKNHPNHVQFFMELATDYIRKSESSVDMEGVIRSGLFTRFIRMGFAQTSEAKETARQELLNFLNDGYTSEYQGGLTSPEKAVSTLIRSLNRLAFFQGIPWIIMFDALDDEKMLGDPPQPETANRFYGQINSFLDSPGCALVLIFAETNLYNETFRDAAEYAKDRIEEGTTTPNGEVVQQIELREDKQAIQRILEKRLTPLHKRLKEACPIECHEELHSLFPFSREVLSEMYPGKPPPIRKALQDLADHYKQLQSPPINTSPEPTPPPSDSAQYQEDWDSIHTEVDKTVETNLSGQSADILSAVVNWLNFLKPPGALGALTQVEIIDDGPSSYETFVHCHWEADGKQSTTALGFLLGFIRGQSVDLRKKLLILGKKSDQLDHTIIYWPKENLDTLAPYIENQFAPGTTKAWNERSSKVDVIIIGAPRTAIVEWLTASEWIMQHRHDLPTNEEKSQEFVLKKTEHLLAQILNRPTEQEA